MISLSLYVYIYIYGWSGQIGQSRHDGLRTIIVDRSRHVVDRGRTEAEQRQKRDRKGAEQRQNRSTTEAEQMFCLCSASVFLFRKTFG